MASPKFEGYNKSLDAKLPKFDPAKAKKLLDDAGWKVGGDGIRVKNGVRLAPVVIGYNAWRERLGSKPRVVVREYPRLNHLFLRGGGFPTREEYQLTGNVDEAVVADIAEWIEKSTAR